MLHQKTASFAKSRGFTYGQIGPVPRARVTDLVSFDDERPAGPSQRVPYLNFSYQNFSMLCFLHCLPLASNYASRPSIGFSCFT